MEWILTILLFFPGEEHPRVSIMPQAYPSVETCVVTAENVIDGLKKQIHAVLPEYDLEKYIGYTCVRRVYNFDRHKQHKIVL
jgi:hypothetical protein